MVNLRCSQVHLNKGKLKMYLDFFFYRCVGLVGSSQRQKVFLSMRGCHDQFPYRVQILRVVFDRKKRASQLELCLKRFRTYLCFFSHFTQFSFKYLWCWDDACRGQDCSGCFIMYIFLVYIPVGLYSPKEHTVPVTNCISPAQNWMKKIIIQGSRWSNLLAHHQGRAGAGAAQAADVRGEWRWSACRNAEGTSAPDPSRDKAKLKYCFLDGRVQSVITAKQTAASILLSSSEMCRFRSKDLVCIYCVWAHHGPTSISVLMQWMWIISLVLLKLVVYINSVLECFAWL